MASPIQVTLSTGNKVTVNYQSQEVGVSVTYQLERGDTDVLSVVRDKAPELVKAHQLAWAYVRGEAGAQETSTLDSSVPASASIEESATDEGLETAPDELLSGAQLNALEALFVQGGWSQSRVEEHLLDEFGKSELTELSSSEAAQLLLELQREARTKAQEARQARSPIINPNGRH